MTIFLGNFFFHNHKYILLIIPSFIEMKFIISTEALRHLLQYLEFTNSLDSTRLQKNVLPLMCDQPNKTCSLVIWSCPDQLKLNERNFTENWTCLHLIATLAQLFVHLWWDSLSFFFSLLDKNHSKTSFSSIPTLKELLQAICNAWRMFKFGLFIQIKLNPSFTFYLTWNRPTQRESAFS